MINKIIQLSDLHIHKSIERHNEYKKVLMNLYKKLDTLLGAQNEGNNLILICGDLVHNKNELHPSQISLLINLFRQLIKYGEVIIINGNHDINLSNSISSMSIFSEFNNKIHIIDETGIYNFDNVDISVIDIKELGDIEKEDEIVKSFDIDYTNKEIINVLVLHKYIKEGMTNTIYNKNEYPIRKNLCSLNVLPKYFEYYDIVCLGDIHQPQFLRTNIAYSGSLIQQNYGEHPFFHGFIEWDILDTDFIGKFHLIHNETGYFQIHSKELIENKNFDLIIQNKFNYSNLSKNCLNIELLCDYQTMYDKEFLQIQNEFKEYLIQKNYTILSFHHSLIQNDKLDLRYMIDKDETNMSFDLLYDEKKLLDIQQQWISSYYKIMNEEHKTEKMCELNKYIYDITHKDGANKLQTTSSHFKFLECRFKNVFCFEENNSSNSCKSVLNIEKIQDLYQIIFKNGIIAIDGYNFSGKSSILDIILFVLFEETTRGKAKKQDILNKNAKYLYIELLFLKNNEKYCINYFCSQKERVTKNKKTLEKEITNSFPSVRKLYKFESNNSLVEIHLENSNQANSFFGYMNYDIFIKSYVLIQNNLMGWLDDGPTERDKFLKKLCKWDDIDLQYKELCKLLLESEKEFKTIEKQKKEKEFLIEKCKSNLIQEDTQLKLKELDDKRIEYLIKIKNYESISNQNEKYNLLTLLNKKDELKKSIENKELELSKLLLKEKEFENFDLTIDVDLLNQNFHQEKKNDLEFLYNKLNELKSNLISIKQNCDITCENEIDLNVTTIITNEQLENSQKEYETALNEKNEMNKLLNDKDKMVLYQEYNRCNTNKNELLEKMNKWNENKEYNKKCKYCLKFVQYDIYKEYEKQYTDNINRINEICKLIDIDNIKKYYQENLIERIYKNFNYKSDHYYSLKKQFEEFENRKKKIIDLEKNKVEIEKQKEWNEVINDTILLVEKEIEEKIKEKNELYEFLVKKNDNQRLLNKYMNEYEKICNVIDYQENKRILDEINIEYAKYQLLSKKQIENENIYKIYTESYEEIMTEYKLLRNKIDDYECYKELFGVNGIPKWLYQQTIPKIQNLMNGWCNELELDFEFEFKYTQGDLGSNYYLLDLGIKHKQNGNQFNSSHEIQLGSGLEKTITNILLRTAFDGLQNTRFDFFFIDETLSNMDSKHLDKLDKLFGIIQKTFKSVFIITHQKEMYEFVNHFIKIHNQQIINK